MGLDERPVPVADSGGGRGRRPGDLVPDREAIGHHLSVVGRRQQVPTGPKVRRDAAERGQEPLRVPDRLEAFHRPLALPGRLVKVLSMNEYFLAFRVRAQGDLAGTGPGCVRSGQPRPGQHPNPPTPSHPSARRPSPPLSSLTSFRRDRVATLAGTSTHADLTASRPQVIAPASPAIAISEMSSATRPTSRSPARVRP